MNIQYLYLINRRSSIDSKYSLISSLMALICFLLFSAIHIHHYVAHHFYCILYFLNLLNYTYEKYWFDEFLPEIRNCTSCAGVCRAYLIVHLALTQIHLTFSLSFVFFLLDIETLNPKQGQVFLWVLGLDHLKSKDDLSIA